MSFWGKTGGEEAGAKGELSVLIGLQSIRISMYLRLEGGAALEEASSSASLPLFRPPGASPRLAEDMFGRSGELLVVSDVVRRLPCIVGDTSYVL